MDFDAPRHVGILAPQPGIKLASPELEGRFITTGPPGKSLTHSLTKVLETSLVSDSDTLSLWQREE